jgi:hypothetical protein
MLNSYNTKYNVQGNNAWSSVASSISSLPFNSITTSSSGQYLAACSTSGTSPDGTIGYIFTSNNYGVDWVEQTNSGDRWWSSITSSSSGQYLAACDSGVAIFTSSDYGLNWTNTTQLLNSTFYQAIGMTSSSSGQYLAVCGGNGLIWLSSNYGVSWTSPILPSPLSPLSSISMSSSGQYLVACSNVVNNSNSYILISNDFGLSWTTNIGVNNTINWTSITSSNNGKYLAASYLNINADNSFTSGVFTSVDYGTTLTHQTSSPNGVQLSSITSSGSGQTIFLCSLDSTYISNDYGLTWNINNSDTDGLSNLCGVAMSTSGQHLAVCSLNGIYTCSNNVDIGTTFGSMIEELQISQNNNSILPSSYFYWNANISNSPTGYIGGSSGVVGSIQGDLDWYFQSPFGLFLTNAGTTNTTAGINWNMSGFDYTRDFEVIVNIYPGGVGGGSLSIGVGCSSICTETGGIAPWAQSGQLGLWTVINTQSVQMTNLCYPGYNTDGSVANVGLVNVVYGNEYIKTIIKITVTTYGGIRCVNTYINNALYTTFSLDPTHLNNGKYLIVTGFQTTFVNYIACSSVELNYI